jgi:hypothetical protein
MAFRDYLDSTNIPSFYNVTMAVGPGCPNRRDDVMLVQYLLNEVFTAPGRSDFNDFGNAIAVDGLCGPITNGAIRKFQNMLRRKGINIATDGRVDRARGRVSAITHTDYTILHLCGTYKKDLERSGAAPDRYDHLDQEPDCPPELAGAIGQSVGTIVVEA